MIFLGLGSNIGDRERHIAHAIRLLDRQPEITIKQVSSLYETEPVGVKEQSAFLNAVISIATAMSPFALLDVCLSIEHQLGRVRDKRWGPRTIDIDLLVYHAVTIVTDILVLPHPYLHVRPFVLIPLREIAGEMIIHQAMTATELLARCEESQVEYYGKVEWRLNEK